MAPTTRPRRWLKAAGFVAVAACLAVAGWLGVSRGGGHAAAETGRPAAALPGAVAVEVVAPRPGGLDRVSVVPGTVEPFEAADLYAKASGFLAEQAVDIGSRVKVGDVLARIAVPEYDLQVKKDAADVRRTEAKVRQSQAAITTADADARSAAAGVALAQAELKSKASYRAYRQKQRDRIKGLFAQQAIDAKLVDEQEDQFEAAGSAELAAGEAVNAATQKLAAAKAKVEQARADESYAETEVAVAKAQLDKSVALLDYTVVKSPYAGVVTRRSFSRGDFVRSADSGGDRVPLLSVERTELMRVVVQVPDRDVPFVNPGDPAVVLIDALPGAVFQTAGTEKVAVSRLADSEDPQTRTMRTEVDVKNPDGRLRRGMYGRVTLTLEVGAAHAVRVPSGTLSAKADGKASVRVVVEGKARTVPVRVGSDNGVEVEILSGLTPADWVIVRSATPVEEGAAVSVGEAPVEH